MSEDSGQGISTRSVHAGDARDPNGALNTPLYPQANFGFASSADLEAVVEGRAEGFFYTRYGMNPTLRALEAKLAALEDAPAALAFSSGMAAIATTLLATGSPGGRVALLGDVYGGTIELARHRLPALGLATAFVEGSDPAALDEVLAAGDTRVVFLETPSNPLLEVIDIAAAARRAHGAGALLVVDGTFASPINQNPLAHGADLVVHSATKYLGGHSDLTAGAAMGRADLIAEIAAWRTDVGTILAPDIAHRLQRSLRTLAVRVAAHNAGASAVADFLAGHPRVVDVRYPGRHGGAAGEVVARQMRGGGGMVSFTYDGSAEQTSAMVDRLRLFALAPSLGGAESLVSQPLNTSHRGMDPGERRARGISDGLVRLSIGLEDAADLVVDLARALDGPAGR
ncbi:MAG: PLP-dependent aspartate aminotransferase family protein [Thermoleophilia bacterium]